MFIPNETIEKLLARASVHVVTPNTYLYVNMDEHVVALEKPGRDTYPVDELESIGYASRFMQIPSAS